jgi:DNA-binding NarL/FixJ family response regulator
MYLYFARLKFGAAMTRARLLIADDHPAVIAQLRSLLEGEFDVVATVGDGLAAVSSAKTLKPDLVVIDLGMPGLDGIDAARQIIAYSGGTRVVMVSVHRDSSLIDRARIAGVVGYVLKDAAGDYLIPTLRAVLTSSSPSTFVQAAVSPSRHRQTADRAAASVTGGSSRRDALFARIPLLEAARRRSSLPLG